jgi:hypothetical protein
MCEWACAERPPCAAGACHGGPPPLSSPFGGLSEAALGADAPAVSPQAQAIMAAIARAAAANRGAAAGGAAGAAAAVPGGAAAPGGVAGVGGPGAAAGGTAGPGGARLPSLPPLPPGGAAALQVRLWGSGDRLWWHPAGGPHGLCGALGAVMAAMAAPELCALLSCRAERAVRHACPQAGPSVLRLPRPHAPPLSSHPSRLQSLLSALAKAGPGGAAGKHTAPALPLTVAPPLAPGLAAATSAAATATAAAPAGAPPSTAAASAPSGQAAEQGGAGLVAAAPAPCAALAAEPAGAMEMPAAATAVKVEPEAS